MPEEPRLYMPKWTHTIMDEVTRNLVAKWEMPPGKARRREEEIRRHFPEAWVESFEPLINAMTNDPGDRHVLAAATSPTRIESSSNNRRHFPPESLQAWEIASQAETLPSPRRSITFCKM